MYTVEIEHQCRCFKKSEYKSEKSFESQKDAYNYSNIVADFMNDEFCTEHLFSAQRVGENEFMIRVADNPNSASSCSTGSCSSDEDTTVGTSMFGTSCSTGSCGC